MEYPQVCLRKGEESDARKGQILFFDNEIDWYDDTCVNGGIVDVVSPSAKFIARGTFNANSKIVVRVLTNNPEEEINAAFFEKRLTTAWVNRRLLSFENSCRVFFGESDGISGLTIDKFGDYLSFQIASLGIENYKQDIVNILADLFKPLGIMERNDLPVREKEGLSQIKQVAYGQIPEYIRFMENDAQMYADLRNGQKTGHFLDQQENRGRIKPYVKDKTVLDLCCCSGGFSVHASLYGAKSVEAVDASADALRLVEKNAALNHCENITITEANVFDLLKNYEESGKRFGTVILDPPAFAKSKRVLENAYRGYKELNLRAMKLVEPGGYLLTFSCSQFMTPELFYKMLRDAAADTGRNVRLLEQLVQSRDHAASITGDSALYLKGDILQVY